MIFFCSKCRLNFKYKSIDDLCSNCKLKDKELYMLYRKCIECIEWFDDPYYICPHVKPLRKYIKKKKWTYATKKRKLDKPKDINDITSLIVPMGFS